MSGATTDGTTGRRGGRKTIRIGLTGPIGCGKSTVAGWLAARGAAVVDADALAREVTEPGHPALGAIVERFGPGVRGEDGALDRQRLAAIVFADPAELAALEAIVHPVVRPRILSAIEAAEADGARAVAVEAIRLVEGGLAELCDEVWLVVCDPTEQRARLTARGMDDADAGRRIAAQEGISERLRPHAGRVIDTSGLPSAAEARVDTALREALALTR
jgi:dephospho-CoA kinase